MQAVSIWGSNIDAQLGIMNTVVRIHGEKDMSRLGIFAVEVLTFNNFKMRTEKRYYIEAYELDMDGTPLSVYYQSYPTKKALKQAFKDFVLPDSATIENRCR